MCGIFGYQGNKTNSSKIVIEGLKRLEYRGYDSWGIAVSANQQLTTQKEVGKISNVNKFTNFPSSHCAIAHTRWATTGAVTKTNAHPHTSSDKSFTLAHNGITENFEELKAKLVQQGYKFNSQTDTEVIVHQIEEEQKNAPNLSQAIQKAFNKLEGRNTIIVLTKDGNIYATRNGSPLVVGINSKTQEIYLSSDALSFAAQANQMLVVSNNQMVAVENGQVSLFNVQNGKKLQYKLEPITIKADKINKEGFDHYMIKEIFDTPEVIKNIYTQEKSSYQKLAKAIKQAGQVYTIGSGTAGFAAAQIAFYLRVYGNVNAISLVGADTQSYYSLFKKNDLIIAPSQSGETADVIEVLEYAKEKGVRIASIVNMQGSIIPRMSNFPFMCNAGPEICVMSTKIFVSQLSWGYLVAKTVQNKFEEGKTCLQTLETLTKTYLNNKDNLKQIKAVAQKLAKKEHIFLLGKYQNLAIINEGMVKIIEGTYRHAHAIPAGDLKHYAITLMEKGVSVLALVSEDVVKTDVLTAINEVRLRGAEVIAVSSKNNSSYDSFIKVPNSPETSAVLNVIPLQLLAYYMALALGNNIDKPRNIAKSVTVK